MPMTPYYNDQKEQYTRYLIALSGGHTQYKRVRKGKTSHQYVGILINYF